MREREFVDLGNRTELVSDPALKALSQVIQLGKVDRTTSFDEKDKLQARECRIIYKKKAAHTSGGPGQFATVASLSPPLYIDPNEIVRRQIDPTILAKVNPSAKKVTDREVRTASAAFIETNATPLPPDRPAARSDW